MRRKIFLLIFIAFLLPFLSSLDNECNDNGVCTIDEGVSVESPEILGESYLIKVIEVNSSEYSATVEVDGQRKIIRYTYKEDHNLPMEFGNFIIESAEFSSEPKKLVRIRYNSKESFCMDSDANEKYPDGLNYFEDGYVTYGGENLGKISVGRDERDEITGKKGIIEKYCSVEKEPSEIIFLCLEGRISNKRACKLTGESSMTSLEEIEDLEGIPEQPDVYIKGKKVNIERGAGGINIIEFEDKSIQTLLEVIEESERIYIKTSRGNKEIKILPEEAIINAKKIDSVSQTKIEEEDGQVVYSISGTKKAKLFFVFSITAEVKQNIEVEDGSIVSTKRPWWHFLAWGV